MNTRHRFVAKGVIAVCLGLFSLTANAAGRAFDLEDARPANGTVIPLNAVLTTIGAIMDEQSSVGVQCDDSEADSVDCGGTPFSFSRVTTPNGYYFTDMIFTAAFPHLEAGDDVLVDLVQSGSHLERRYLVGESEDNRPPTAPSNVHVDSVVQYVGGTNGAFAPVLVFSWDPSQDDTSVAYYRIEKVVDGELQLASVRAHQGTSEHSMVVQIELSEQVNAVIRAVDIAGNVSPPSAVVSATGSAFVPPSACSCTNSSRLPPSTFAILVMCLLGAGARRKRRHFTA